MPEDDRRALAARLATTAPAAADVVAEAVDEGEELREVLVDVDGEVVALTDRRALLAGVGGAAITFGYDAVEVRRRGEGLGIDAVVEGGRLVLDVARSTFVRLGVLAEGNPPARATWLPVRAPKPRPVVLPVPDAAVGQAGPPAPAPAPSPSPSPSPPPGPGPRPAAPALPPPGWHPDPSGRHWWRWWDGVGWTDHVADGGAPDVDPLPPR
jgi:hypothetical protein